jgi:hypothetical protein
MLYNKNVAYRLTKPLKTHMRKSYLLILILYFLSSCLEKETSLTVIDRIDFNDNETGIFQYNSDGKISKYEYYIDGEIEYYTDYVYSNGLLVNEMHNVKGKNGFISFTDTFIYENDKVVEVSNSIYSGKYHYEWENERIHKVSFCLDKDFCLGFEILEYDSKGNIKEVHWYSIENGNERLNYILEFSYDDNINPFQNLANPANLFSGPLNYYEASINNISKITKRVNFNFLPYQTITFSNSYYDSGFPDLVNKYEAGSTETLLEKRKYYYKIIKK